MSTTTTTPAWRRLTATVLGAGAIAIGGMALLAPAAAYAEPNTAGTESAGHKECREAGGDYSSESDAGGNTFEKCCYQSIFSGVTHCDVWVNGEWNKDLSFHEEPPVAPPKPGGPPKVGGTPELSPDAQNPPTNPKNPPKSSIPGRTVVAK
jgi:hypothetical protein